MYSADFDYYRARSLAEAQQLLAAHPGAKLLAGGHSLIPLLKLRLATPPALIDIGRVPELRGIAVSGGPIRIGALTTHAELAASADVRRSAAGAGRGGGAWSAIPRCGTAARSAATSRTPIRRRICRPCSSRSTPASSSSGRAASGRSTRSQFFTGIMTTALADDEICRRGRGAGSRPRRGHRRT